MYTAGCCNLLSSYHLILNDLSPWSSNYFIVVWVFCCNITPFHSRCVSGTTLTAIPATAMVTVQAQDGTRMGPTRQVGHHSSLSNNNNLRGTTTTLANQWDSSSTLAAGTESKREYAPTATAEFPAIF